MTKPIPLQSFRLKNFKAVRDSGTIKFGPLTVFIGDNGSGKSSIVEGLETLQAIVTYDLDMAMLPWRNFRDILNKAVPHKEVEASSGNRAYHTNPMSFDLRGQLVDRMSVKYSLEVSDGPSGNDLFIKQEALSQKGRNVPLVNVSRDASGHATGTCEAKVQNMKNPERVPNPKERLYDIFQQNGCRKYDDLKDAEKIVKLVSISKLQRSKAFARFEKIIRLL